MAVKNKRPREDDDATNLRNSDADEEDATSSSSSICVVLDGQDEDDFDAGERPPQPPQPLPVLVQETETTVITAEQGEESAVDALYASLHPETMTGSPSSSAPPINPVANLILCLKFAGTWQLLDAEKERRVLEFLESRIRPTQRAVLCLLYRRRTVFSIHELLERYPITRKRIDELTMADVAIGNKLLHPVDLAGSDECLRECVGLLTVDAAVMLLRSFGIQRPPGGSSSSSWRKEAAHKAILDFAACDADCREAVVMALGDHVRVDETCRSAFFWCCDVVYTLVQKHTNPIGNPTTSAESGSCQRAYLVMEMMMVDPQRLPTACHFEGLDPDDMPTATLPFVWCSRKDVDEAVFAMRCRWSVGCVHQQRLKLSVTPDWVRLYKNTIVSHTPIGVDTAATTMTADAVASRVAETYSSLSPTTLWLHAAVLLAECCELAHDFANARAMWSHILQHGTYRPRKRGYFFYRLALCVESLGSKSNALSILETAWKECTTMRMADRLSIEKSGKRMSKPPMRWSRFPQTPMKAPTVVTTFRGVRDDASKRWRCGRANLSVEEYALQQYLVQLGPQWRGVHCEGALLTGLFHLLLWDVIHSRVALVLPFPCPYMSLPVDMATDVFIRNRSNALRKRLAQVRAYSPTELEMEVRRLYTEKSVYASGLQWDLFDVATLAYSARSFTGRVLAELFDYLLRENAFSGLPDLWMWRHDWEEDIGDEIVVDDTITTSTASVESGRRKLADVTSSGVHILASEVKGPNDSLSEKQIAWITVLRDVGIHIEVCHVQALHEIQLKP
eukprot:PhM_4_TR14398/c0_g1_i1/m.10212/K15363/FAN1, MTMR15; fanconi-associated nuclease 1